MCWCKKVISVDLPIGDVDDVDVDDKLDDGEDVDVDVYDKQDDGEQGACVGARKLSRLICPSGLRQGYPAQHPACCYHFIFRP